MGRPAIAIEALAGMPHVAAGDDLAALLIAAVERAGIVPRLKDILVVTQKIMSKAAGRQVDLAMVEPSARARELAAVTGKDPRIVEAILSESVAVVRAAPGVLIVETRHGFVMANAGLDQSNVGSAPSPLSPEARLRLDVGEDRGGGESGVAAVGIPPTPGPSPQGGGEKALRLPVDPDADAAALKAQLDAHFATDIGVIVSDSVGRAWRLGTVGLAIGAAGVPSLIDRRGEADLVGRRLEHTEVAFADAVAAAAVAAMGEAAEGTPAAWVRGFTWRAPARPAAALVRPRHMDLFR